MVCECFDGHAARRFLHPGGWPIRPDVCPKAFVGRLYVLRFAREGGGSGRIVSVDDGGWRPVGHRRRPFSGCTAAGSAGFSVSVHAAWGMERVHSHREDPSAWTVPTYGPPRGASIRPVSYTHLTL